jgi:nitrogen regulatory protein PII 2
MKEVIAIIRIDKMNATKQALSDAGISSLTARRVIGRGKGKVDYMLLQGAQDGIEEAINQLGPGPKLLPKRMLTIVVSDNKANLVVRTLIKANQTGSPGDGKIFVGPVLDAIRVRTGETSDSAVADDEPAVAK